MVDGLWPSPEFDTWTWPASQVGTAVAELAHEAGLITQLPTQLASPLPLLDPSDEETVTPWLSLIAGQLGVEIESVQTTYGEVEEMLQQAGPALLSLPERDGAPKGRFVALLKSSRWGLRVIASDGSRRWIPLSLLRDAWCATLNSSAAEPLKLLLTAAGLSGRRRANAQRAILTTQLGGIPLRGCWLLRLSPNVPLLQQVAQTRLAGTALLFVAAEIMSLLLSLASWWLIGHSALTEQFEPAWMWCWALLILSAFGFQALATLTQGWLATSIGGLLRLRLLFGSLQLEPEEIRHQGMGQFLGRIFDTEAISQLSLTGGFAVMMATLQFMAALGVLMLGAGGHLLAVLLLLWGVGTGILLWRDFKQTEVWTQSYRAMTHDLVERMVGHRTRLAQEAPASWHDQEDQLLHEYLSQSVRLDRLGITIQAMISRGWILVGVLGLLPELMAGPPSAAGLAVSLGGIMLANQALTQLTGGAQSLVGAAVAWKQLQPLLQAATRPIAPLTRNGLRLSTEPLPVADHDPVLQARGLGFHYSETGPPVLRDCNLLLGHGDRLLLEGISGGGKSTLAALLSGLREPTSGVLLLMGYDRQSLGHIAWRRQVVSVPQFHENHVFTGTFAFNLLMGRRWPPEPADLRAAEAVCRQLGLGDLVDRMPARMQQMVGESGWQLSHGERSRLYIARALLQGAEVMILDESFASLDPATLERSLNYVFEQVPTLLVIAHP